MSDSILENRLRSRAKPDASGATPAKQKAHFWLRWAHVYISMLSLLIVLFFGVTGITLNHPEWVFGDEPTTEVIDATLPLNVLTPAHNR